MGQRLLGSNALHCCLSRSLSLPWAVAVLTLAGGPLLRPAACQADQRILVISGDVQPGGVGAQVAGVASPSLNNSGQAVLQVRLADGVGGIDAHNDASLWLADGNLREVLAWKGAGDLQEGASFASFGATSIADDGDVVYKAATDAGNQGIWRAPRAGTRSTIALTATPGVPGPQLEQAEYDSFGFLLLQAPQDVVVFNSRLKRGVGGVDNTNSRGAWLNNGTATSLLFREFISEVPGLLSARFLVPSIEGVNNLGQTAMLGSLVAGHGDVSNQDALAIWRMGRNAAPDVIVARRSHGEAPGVAGALFGAFSDLRLNSDGALSYVGELQLGGDVTAENNRGFWLFDGSENRLVARTGSAAPALPGTIFESLDVPLLNDAGQLLFAGGLKAGVGGVTAGNAKGVWIADGLTAGALVARSGVGGVPGAPAAKFAEFGSLAFNASGVAALAATLEVGSGGVDFGNEQGLWLMDASGDGQLVARTGDVVAGRTVIALEFVGGSGGDDGRQRALNRHGEFAYKATFANGEEAAMLYTPALKWRAPEDGNWDDPANWTLGLTPSNAHHVELSTPSAATVAGPTGNVTVKRLQLGGGAGETTLEIPASGMLNVTEGLYLAANGRLAGKGTLVGEVINAGATSPGASTGVLAIEGDYLQEASGRLTIEIGGNNNSSSTLPQFDQLLVFGHADLGGTLDVSLVNDYIPAIGDSFPILKATDGLTAFDAINLPTLPSDRAWATTTSLDTFALKVVATAPASPADFNGDGDVDGDDLAAWQSGFGGTAAGDADGSGWVDGHDFLVWQQQFTGSGGGLQTSVPEPAGAMMLFVAVALAGASLRGPRVHSASSI